MNNLITPITNNIGETVKDLNKILEHYEYRYSVVEQKYIVNNRLNVKLEQLHVINKSQIKINAGGSYSSTSKATIKNCIYDNILKDELQSLETEEIESKEIFVDIELKYFEPILEILRRTQKEENFCSGIFQVEDEDKFVLGFYDRINCNCDRDQLNSYIKIFFYNDYEKIIKKFFGYY
jgi:hypothetical protein